MDKKIKFTCFFNSFDKDDAPKPSKLFIPEWYKSTNPYIDSKKSFNKNMMFKATIKKCIPILDSITSGYIITTPMDLYISKRKNIPMGISIIDEKDIKEETYYEWPLKDFSFIEMHPIEQAKLHPQNNLMDYPKFMNPWGIKTPKGYSCLFINPVHRENDTFSILEGIVDTDTYNLPVNFPFVLKDSEWTGMIPKGTPIVQILPFKRDSWGSEYDFKNTDELNINLDKFNRSFFDKYKNKFWQKKQYK